MFVFRKTNRQRILPIKKATGEKADVLKRLRAFLDAEEPQTIEWLVSTWGNQQAAITYKELKEIALNGWIFDEQLFKWQTDYATLINTKLAPQWEAAMTAASQELQKQFPYFLYDPSVGAAQEYIKQHGAELVANLVEEQQDALRAMVARAAHYDGMTTDSLSRIMRPVIGLTEPQTLANLNYWVSAWQNGIDVGLTSKAAEKRAYQLAENYAAQQHRYRAQNIARTELARAYNAGHYDATLDAQDQGYIGDCKKIWLTADDERTCSTCSKIDRESRNMDDMFSIGVQIPPAHPSCRCAVVYEEIAPPLLTNPDSSSIIDMTSTEETQINEFTSLIDTLPDMSDEYKAALISRFKDGKNEAKDVYLKYVNANSVADGKNKSAYYQPATQKIYMNFQSDLKDKRGAGNTFFHEHGHYIDYNSRQSKLDPAASRKILEFGAAIRNDLKNLEQEIISLHGVKTKTDIYDKIKSEILSKYSMADVNGISDIMESVTKIPYPMGYGHGIAYWKNVPVEIEAFAHMYAAQFDAVKLKAMQEYLPSTLEEFSKILKGFI